MSGSHTIRRIRNVRKHKEAFARHGGGLSIEEGGCRRRTSVSSDADLDLLVLGLFRGTGRIIL